MVSVKADRMSKILEKRLAFLCEMLGIHNPPPGQIRYRLFHHTCSALLEAKRFLAKYAVILVHSFSNTDEGLQDYRNFVSLFCSTTASVNGVVDLGCRDGVQLFSAWVRERGK